MYRIIEINKKIIYHLISELNNYANFFDDLPLNFSDGNVSLNNSVDRNVLQKAFEILKTINISEPKKQILESFGTQLMTRDV